MQQLTGVERIARPRWTIAAAGGVAHLGASGTQIPVDGVPLGSAAGERSFAAPF